MNNNKLESKYGKYSELPEYYKNVVGNFIDTALDVVKKTLKTEKGFYPFAQYLDDDNNYGIIGIDEDLSKNSIGSIDSLKDRMIDSMKNDNYIAISLAYEVRISSRQNIEEKDAICIDIKILNCFTCKYVYPYIVKEDSIEYMEPVSMLPDILL